MSTTKAEYEAELAVIKARADYYERPDLISRRTFLETELNRLINGATQPGNKPGNNMIIHQFLISFSLSLIHRILSIPSNCMVLLIL